MPSSRSPTPSAKYHFDAVPAGRVRITAWGFRYKTVPVDTAIVDEQQLGMDFVLHALEVNVIPAGRVNGVVRDTAGRPVTGAVVSVSGMSRGVVTDSLGQYRIDSVPTGVVHLLIRRLGYHVARVDTTLAEAGQQLRVDFVLQAVTCMPSSVVPASAIARGLHLEQLGVLCAARDELFVRPLLHHAAVREHDDPIGHANGRESV